MSYRAANGQELEYAWKHAYPMLNEGDKGKARADYIMRLWGVMEQLDREVITLREESKRLRHENEFMLRIMNEKEQTP